MSWAHLSMRSGSMARRCVAFPCEPEALSSAVAAVRAVGSVKQVYYWRNRRYCVCELRRPILLQLLYPVARRRWFKRLQLPVPNLLPAAPHIDGPLERFKMVTVSEQLPPADMALRLAEFRSLSAQIVALENALRPEVGDLLLRTMYIQSVQALLTAVMPDAQVQVFGSFVSGLWTKSGDLDIAVDFAQEKPGLHEYVQKILENQTRHKLVILRRLLALTGGDCISHAIPILQTRGQILKVQHNTGLSIDFSLVNAAHIRLTSVLLRAILEASVCPELQPLSLFLKWHLRNCKHFNVGGRLSGFKLTMLVIFFLQERRLLPPLQPLMDDLAAGRPLRAPARSLRPELLGDLFRDLLAFLVDLCDQEKVFFDIRTGRSGRWTASLNRGSVFVCPEPNLPELDIMNLDSGTVERLRICCSTLADALRDGNFYQPAHLKKQST